MFSLDRIEKIDRLLQSFEAKIVERRIFTRYAFIHFSHRKPWLGATSKEALERMIRVAFQAHCEVTYYRRWTDPPLRGRVTYLKVTIWYL
ncbi:MAG: hypothetical protein ACFFFC_14340 [Candidatus Thorarchaeota archaeon]